MGMMMMMGRRRRRVLLFKKVNTTNLLREIFVSKNLGTKSLLYGGDERLLSLAENTY